MNSITTLKFHHHVTCLKYQWSLITSFYLGPCLQWHAYFSSQQNILPPQTYINTEREMNISSIQCVVVIKLFQIKHKMGAKIICSMLCALKSSHIPQIWSQIWKHKRLIFISDSDLWSMDSDLHTSPKRSQHSRWVSRVQPCGVHENYY